MSRGNDFLRGTNIMEHLIQIRAKQQQLRQ